MIRRLRALLIITLGGLACAVASPTITGAEAYWHVSAASAACQSYSYASNDATMRLYGKRASHVYFETPDAPTVPPTPGVSYMRISSSRVSVTIWRATTDLTLAVLSTCDSSGTSTTSGYWPETVVMHSFWQGSPFYI